MTFFAVLLLFTFLWNTQATNRETSFEARTLRPFPQMSDSEDDSTKMQVVVVLLVAFCVSLAITVIIRFLRKYSERQRLYSSFN
uniref:Small integral membrane protein 27 n=1 Tax=Caenorhabditis tropicalis TaxID=1561998 RepID=A0A1I7ULB6_9PELO